MRVSTLIYFLLFFTSCTYNEIILEEIDNECATEISPSFSNCVQPIINSHCVNCHHENSQWSLVDYISIKNMVENKNLIGRIKTDMPPNGILPENEIQIIENWINDGAKDN